MTCNPALDAAEQRATLALTTHLHAPTDDSLGLLADAMSAYADQAAAAQHPERVAAAIARWGALDAEDALALAEEFEPGISVLGRLPGVASALAQLA